jgi:hypothetical protein
MKNLPHTATWLPLLAGTLAYYLGLGWLRLSRRTELRKSTDPATPRTVDAPRRPRPTPPDDDWCPAHDCWYGAETECPGCREEWETTWALGEEPCDEDLHRRDDWTDREEEAAAADSDGWYLDLVNRAANGWNGADGYPEGGAL